MLPLNWDLSIYTEEQAREFLESFNEVYRVEEETEHLLPGVRRWKAYMND